MDWKKMLNEINERLHSKGFEVAVVECENTFKLKIVRNDGRIYTYIDEAYESELPWAIAQAAECVDHIM